MTKYQSLLIYGSLVIMAGIVLIICHQQFTVGMQYTIAALMLLSAVFAYITSTKNKNKLVRFRYHELHALSFMIYSILMLWYIGSNYSVFITSYFMMYYGISEMIFCIWLFNLKTFVNFTILIIRLVMGLVIYVSAVMIQMIAKSNQSKELIGYGFVFILIGIHILLYRPVIQKLETEKAE